MAPISVGELMDKITILMIKQERIFDPIKLANIERELGQLSSILKTLTDQQLSDTAELLTQLLSINNELWDIENYKRYCEATNNFDLVFIQAARNVYLKNDERARIKREINTLCSSDIVEEKSY
jgi:hypothetical protein